MDNDKRPTYIDLEQFTQAGRDRVKEVFDGILDELSDSFDIKSMFAPYGEIVEKILTDERIEQNRVDWEFNNENAF